MMLKVNFIGCGKLGKSLGKLLVHNKLAHIGGIVNRSLVSSRAAVEMIGQGTPCAQLEDLPPADCYFITTPDDQIQATAQALIQKHALPPHALLIHTSGALSAEILRSANNSNPVACVHLLKSFAHPVASLQGVFGVFDGSETAYAILRPIFEKLGTIFLRINPEHKIYYHLASVMANNFLVGLHYQSVLLYQQGGIPEPQAKQMASQLMHDALQNINLAHSHAEALTGPLQRGDVQTIKKHLQAVDNNEVVKNIYHAMVQGMLPLVGDKN